MAYKITLIPGDGIGPEVTDAAKTCLGALDLDILWEERLAGQTALDKYHEILPQATLESIKKNKVALKGPITTPVGKGFRSVNVALRQKLELYAGVRPCQSIAGTKSKYENVNLVVVREGSEDLYAGVEFKKEEADTEELISRMNQLSKKEIRSGSALSIKPISHFASARISRFAFELARKEDRKKVTCVHKANIMKYTDGLFLQAFREVAENYTDIEAEDIIVDNLAMQLVRRPDQFDILVLPNLYGDIISDLCSGLTGGLGLTAGANFGADIAIFEPAHGSAPKYAAKNKVNPTAMLLSTVMLLKHIGEENKANILKKAIYAVIKDGSQVTYDLKTNKDDPSAVGTKEMTEAIVSKINEIMPQ